MEASGTSSEILEHVNTEFSGGLVNYSIKYDIAQVDGGSSYSIMENMNKCCGGGMEYFITENDIMERRLQWRQGLWEIEEPHTKNSTKETQVKEYDNIGERYEVDKGWHGCSMRRRIQMRRCWWSMTASWRLTSA